jgi:glutamate/tyrosine decarboxylase-like PLP-dependent enzyme
MAENPASKSAEPQACAAEEVALKSLFLGPQSENGPWLRAEVDRIFEHWFGWRTALHPEDGRAISAADQTSAEFLARRELFARNLGELVRRLEREVPTFSPRYVGHMVSEISLPGLTAHLATLLHNPNLISAEIAPVGEALEREAIGFLLAMVGLDPQQGRGHFTSGGTVANIEALWRARYRMDHWLALGAWLRRARVAEPTIVAPASFFEAAHQGWELFYRRCAEQGIGEPALRELSLVLNNPWRIGRQLEQLFGHSYLGPVVLVPRNKHYSWSKAVSLLGLGQEAFWEIDLDARGKLDVEDLERQIRRAQKEDRPVLMVVSVTGTTEMGEIDPVDAVQDLLDRLRDTEGLHLWHHVDAAYGGFFCTLLGDRRERSVLAPETASALEAIRRVDSLTIDPHKLGYVPYSCGAFLARDALHYQVSSFSAPYLATDLATDEQTKEGWQPKDIWNRTLEGSRPASGAAATWLTAKTIGLGPEGYGRILERSILARQRLEQLLAERVAGCVVVPGCDTNILCFCVARAGEKLSVTNARSQRLRHQLEAAGEFFLSKTDLSLETYRRLVEQVLARWDAQVDAPSLRLLRVVLMNPFVLSREPEVDYLAALADRIAELAASDEPR